MLVLSKTTLMKGSPPDAGAPVAIAPSPLEWLGTSRYEVRGRIGAGGMGAVYKAFDHERGHLVAVKTLLRFTPAALYRFKQEFRTLADVVHPNLVHLYELVATDPDHVFFAMELVRGVDFLIHGTGLDGASRAARTHPSTSILATGAPWTDADRTGPYDAAAPPPPPRPVAPSLVDLKRLRPALKQLVAGVSALHAAGKLHRDIKPSNVLVTPEGRVVLLDFGVAADLSRGLQEGAGEREVVGTARYMAPEQAMNEAPTPASDWYSVGAMLYEVLVGRPPFSGSSAEVLTRKSLVDAQAPSETVTGIPEDLDTFCVALLRRQPRARPRGEEIVRWLDGRRLVPGRSPVPSPYPSAAAPAGETPFVGRDVEQRALREALDAARVGRRLVTVRVHGAAGMGASALVRHFVGPLAERGEATLLRGRAYARESMPYKALDSMVDALSRYLMRRGATDPSTALPRDIAALAQLFPVLSRIERVHDAPAQPGRGPLTVRRRAIDALRELLAQIAADRPLVLWIDDVQWGDVDSAELILGLVSLPLDAPVLLLLNYRDDEEDASPFLVETRRRWPLRADVRDVALGRLAAEDARHLAKVLLAAGGDATGEAADSIASESGGSPLLVDELARSVARSGSAGGSMAPPSPGGVVRLESVVAGRMATLPAEAARLLELLALSARPLPVAILGDAAGLYEPLDEAIAALRERRFVRTGFRDGREVVEMLHDRVRETIVAQLSPETVRDYHGRLARVLEPVPGVDTEALAVHLLGAGERARAAQYAGRAAEQAAHKLAFGQAIRLYRLEIEILGGASLEVRRAQVRLAEVLERAGHGLEAARMYQVAAARARGFERMELEREGAGQLLHTGHLHEGDAALGRILAAAGMRRPRRIFGALLWWIFYRVALVLSGSRWAEREVYDVRPVDHLQIEAMHMLVVGLSFTNVVHGVCMQPRHLFLALRAGDRFQVLRAAGIEALNVSARGGAVGRRERVFGAIVERMAAKLDDTDARAFDQGTRGVRMFLHGDWREAGDLLDDAIERYGAAPAGWLSNARLFSIYSQIYRGKLMELRLHHTARLAEAEERGDLYITVNLRIGHCNGVWLMMDDVDAARRHVREAMAEWKEEGFSLQHYRALLAEANIELYAGAGEAAYGMVAHGWPQLRRSLFLYVQYVRGDAYSLRARCALASGRLAEAARYARKLERERMLWTSTLASLIRAGVARAAGDREGEIAHLRAAADHADAADMQLHAAVARMRLGAALGAGEGDDLALRARSWMAEQGIARPDRLAAMLAPLAPGGPLPPTREME
jgi:eukaryotic-like serine/threonine-protein kinase